MATQSPHREAEGKAPAAQGFSPTVPEPRCDKGSDLSPWPVVDTPGRPLIISGDRLADQIRSWVIAISLTLMGVAILGTLIDRYLDGAL